MRFLPPDEVARLKADLEKKRKEGLAAQRKKQRAAGQPVAPGPAPAIHIPGMTPPGTATKKQREDMARLLEEQMRARRAALADEEERRRQAELERLEAERLAALEAERLAEEARERARVEAELEALRVQREEEERAGASAWRRNGLLRNGWSGSALRGSRRSCGSWRRSDHGLPRRKNVSKQKSVRARSGSARSYVERRMSVDDGARGAPVA